MIRISTGVRSLIELVVCVTGVAALGCSPAGGTGGGRAQAGAEAVAPRVVPPVSERAAAFYRRAFANAARFVAKPIPLEMLRSLDQGNDVYVQAYDAEGHSLGYLRDFSGKITLSDNCACDPLSLTLVFDAARKFETIISAAPLTKLDHKPFTDDDMARLLAIAKTPPQSLSDERRTEAMVDATTGATVSAFAADVVPHAALTSHRVVGLVRDTERILQGAPLAVDRQRLQALLGAEESPGKAAVILADFVPTADSDEVAADAYRLMLRAYVEHLRSGGKTLPPVETRLIEPNIDPAADAVLAVDACYNLLTVGQPSKAAARCAERWASDVGPAGAAALARLRGSLAFLEERPAEAVPALRQAAAVYDVGADPWLHLRLGQALAATGQNADACSTGRALFMEHALFPGVKKLLAACQPDSGDVVAVLEELYGVQRAALMARRIYGNPQVPDLPVEDKNLNGVDLRLYEAGKVSVVVFFATWCPHCQTEMPRLVAFERAMQAQRELGPKVRVLGIRTGLEREVEPFDAFVARHGVRFPVWSDPVMSLALSKFARSQGLAAGIPLVAVIDEAGYPKYFLESGDHRDTARELVWAVRDVLDNPSREPSAPPASGT